MYRTSSVVWLVIYAVILILGLVYVTPKDAIDGALAMFAFIAYGALGFIMREEKKK